ncbi:MAG: DUF711 family protein, partial [Crenarchaeota archaeon]|nr:DUF711 family protein [Thermoproteota archaeon]
ASEAAAVLEEAVKTAGGLSSGIYYGLLRVDAAAAEPGDVLRVLRLGGNVFASVHTPAPTERAAETLWRIAAEGPRVAERFSVSIPGPVESPYLPAGASLSPSSGLSAALLYPRLLRGRSSIYVGFDDLADVAAAVEEALLETAARLGVDYLGLDLSLSPWMDESVAEVIEEYAGASIDSLGVAWTIRDIEELVEDVCSDVACIGYNQVMLPLAEDNLLKKRAVEGKLDLYKLAHLSYTCTAGVDMVPVPRSRWTPETAAALLREVAAAAAVKGKPLGIRLIAADAEAGQFIDMNKFGLVPIVRID